MIFEFLNLGFLTTAFVVKAFFSLLIVFYIVFAVIIFRQTQLMARSLPTALSPALMFISILHIGVSLAFLFVFLGAF